MTPIYFPFTFISEPILDKLWDTFGKIVVYQSSKINVPEKMTAWEKSGKIDIRMPVEGNDEKIEKILQEFKSWADLLQGGELSLLKTQLGKIPFFNEDATSQIKLDIKRQDLKKPSEEKPERLLVARMFLQVAQELDLQNDSLRQDLLSLEAMDQHLIKELTGETLSSSSDVDTYQPVETNDAGQYMTKERIDAWTRIMLQDRQQSGLFITNSRAVMEHLLDDAPEAKILSDLNDMTASEKGIQKHENRKNRILHHLETIAADAASAAASAATKTAVAPSLFKEKARKKTFTFYLIPGLSPHQFFSRYMVSAGGKSKSKRFKEPVKNTLIGWYDR